MHRMTVIALVGLLLVLAVTGAAYAPYHTSPTYPPSQPTQSGGFKAQAKTAAAHASFAADGSSVSYVKEHLTHVTACIEGPKGKNVKAAWENPCKGQGNGVLVDLNTKGGSAWILVAQAADGLVVSAHKGTDLTQMKKAAKGVAELMALIAGEEK